jgi:hypothetical protein
MVTLDLERDLDTGIHTIRFIGDFSAADGVMVRSTVGKAVAECPTGLLIDLSRFHPDEDASLDILGTLNYHARESWGVPVLLFGADPSIRHRLRPYRTFVALYEDRPQAVMALRANVPRWVRETYPPSPGSAAACRSLMGEVCLAWGLLRLRETARLVVSELAANAIMHAGTDFDVLIVYTGRFLRVAVHDGSKVLPLLGEKPATALTAISPGTGLLLVAAITTHWGTTVVKSGKIVWAVMAAHQQ